MTTDEVMSAWAAAQPLLAAGDAVAARMAFLAKYREITAHARIAGRAPQMTVSVGTDRARAETVLSDAVKRGLLPESDPHVRGVLAPRGMLQLGPGTDCDGVTHFVRVAPCEEWPRARFLASLAPAGPSQRYHQPVRIGARTWRSLWAGWRGAQVMKPEELTADDLDTLAKLQRTDFEPQIRELTHQVGQPAAEKLIAYAQRKRHMFRPRLGRFASQSPGDCYESCGRPAVADSSRCAVCGPAARDRAATGQDSKRIRTHACAAGVLKIRRITGGEETRQWDRIAVSHGQTTFNPWWNLKRRYPQAVNCYAETFASGRMGLPIWERRLSGACLETRTGLEPLKWNRINRGEGKGRACLCFDGRCFENYQDRALSARE